MSEERGEISLVTRGSIERRLTPEDLRFRLQSLILNRSVGAPVGAPAELDA